MNRTLLCGMRLAVAIQTEETVAKQTSMPGSPILRTGLWNSVARTLPSMDYPGLIASEF